MKEKLVSNLVESLKVVRLAEQESQIRRFTFIEVGQIYLTVAVFALGTLLMKYGPIKIYLRIHHVYCLGANLFDRTTREEKYKIVSDTNVMTTKIIVRFCKEWGDKGR